MSALFSRRPGKNRRFPSLKTGNGNAPRSNRKDTTASPKHNPFGAGISNVDLPEPHDDISGIQPRQSVDVRILHETHNGNGNGSTSFPHSPGMSATASKQPLYSKSLPAHPVSPIRYEGSVDDFGRLQSKVRNGASTVPTRHEREASRIKGDPRISLHTVKGSSSNRLAAELPLPPSPNTGGMTPTGAAHGREAFPYGYTHEGWDMEMTLPSALQIVELCAKEIRERGLDSPLIFSSMALDLSSRGVASLLKALANSDISNLTNSPLAEEARFTNPHNLAALVKWTLARLGRFYAVPVPSAVPTKKGEINEDVAVVQQRGWLDLDIYLHWREEEKAFQYPWTAFSHFLQQIDEDSANLLCSLFSLLSSTCSYSLKNGMTPSKLARHFGVILFGLPEDETFARTYDAYNRASNATEHLFLAYIRDVATSEVLPIRLMSHVEDYPQVLATDLSRPPRHVRLVPFSLIERQVRLYSQDLIQSAGDIDVAWLSAEWEACCSTNEHHGKGPQLSDGFRKLINLKGTAQHGREATSTQLTASSSLLPLHTKTQSEDPALYGTIAEERWGNFMSDGFSGTDTSKLNFDLHESQRRARSEKRNTVLWSDFTDIGFGEEDALDAVLSFDEDLKNDVTRLPPERAELLAKLRDTAAHMPPFSYDTAPKVVSRPSTNVEFVLGSNGEIIPTQMDEVFAEVWADYLIGNGWSNRDELTHRSANFVVVQFKSRSNEFTVGAHGNGSTQPASAIIPLQTAMGDDIPADDRIDAAWFVVQETVPSGYRAELEAIGKVKSRSRPSIRNLNVFKKLGKNRNVTTSATSPFGYKNDNDVNNLFPPGTKKLTLGNDPATRSEPSNSIELQRRASSKKYRGGFGGEGSRVAPLFSTSLVPDREKSLSRSERDPYHHQGGTHKFVTAVRNKTMRLHNHQRRDSGSRDHSAATPPPPPPKNDGALLFPVSSQITQRPQNGGFPTSASGTQSFCSADFDAHSVQESGDELRASDATKSLSRTRSLLRHRGKQQSRDDTWVDIVTRSPDLSVETATLPSQSRNAGGSETLSVVEEQRRNISPKPSPRIDATTVNVSASSPNRSVLIKTSSRGDLRKDDESAPTPTGANSTLDVAPAPTSGAPASTSSLKPLDNAPSVIIPDRSMLKQVATDAQIREERISAAQARARELRAKLQPVEARKVQRQTSTSDGSISPSGSTAITGTNRVPSKGKIDPFAKNPTSGKVASIAARFGAVPGTPGSPNTGTSPPTTKTDDLSPRVPTYGVNERSPSPLHLAQFGGSGASPGREASRDQSSSNTSHQSTRANASGPSASKARSDPPSLPNGMVDPDVPPSPRRPDSLIGSAMIGDNDSIAPDDAASNYSRSTEDGLLPPPSGTMPHGENGPRGWDKSSHAQHASQQAMQNMFLTGSSGTGIGDGGTGPPSDGGGGGGGNESGRPSKEEIIIFSSPPANDDLEEEEDAHAYEQRLIGERDRELELLEASDGFSPLTTGKFREPYQPGQPLENLLEESESMLSGSNVR